MSGNLLRRIAVALVAVLAVVSFVPAAGHCPFCGGAGQTMIGEVNQAALVLFGSFENAKADPDNFGQGTTDLAIDTVIKNNEALGDKKLLTVARYIPVQKNKKTKYIVFCDVFKGKIDPYRTLPVESDGDFVKYLKGALAIKDKPAADRLKFYFNYLDNPEIEINSDAYQEFANADYKDYHDMAKELSAARISILTYVNCEFICERNVECRGRL